MSTSLIRSRAIIAQALDHQTWQQINDGAVLQEDGVIAAVGTYADLRKRYPNTAVIGSGNEIMLPGFVNGHHHVGLTRCSSARPTCRWNCGFNHPHGDAQSQHLFSTRSIRRSR